MIAKDYVKLLTIDEKISLLSETAPEIERLGIRRYHHGNEALHGVVRPGRFTVFPQAIGMAAAFSPELLKEVASAISDEARARHNQNRGEMLGGDFEGLYNGLLTFWSPNLNAARDPRWGRTGETYGEDPYLIGECGKSFIAGLQGEDENCLKTVATPKHFVGNNEEHNRFECDAVIPREVLFDYFLPPFETAVKEAGCASVMGSYNAVNGVPCHASSELLTDILRGRWGFKGYVASDCGAVSHLVDRHNFVGTPAQAAAVSLKAGVDLECGSCGSVLQVYKNHMKEALDQGLITEEELDRAVLRVITAREKLGILGECETIYDELDESVIGCEEHRALALEMAEESLVLLKNEDKCGKPLLPYKPGSGRICVIGNQADRCQFGDYSGQPVHEPMTILAGLKEIYGEENITYIPYRRSDVKDTYQVIQREYLFHREDGQLKTGLKGRYQQGEETGAFSERVDEVIDFEWENMAPDPLIKNEVFSVRWKGILLPAVSGTYKFGVVYNKNGCKCNGKFCICINGEPAHLEPFYLVGNREYQIELVYENNGARPSVSLLWKLCRENGGSRFERELRAAMECDIVIACLGLGTEYEAEGRDKEDLNLPKEQLALLEAVTKVNDRVAVTLYNGSSLTIPWLKEHVPAILECWYPGEEGGRAIANILSGKVSPGGRLPLTFYRDVEDIPSFQCYDIREGFTYWYAEKVMYPFGYGLSYTTFLYDSFYAIAENNDVRGAMTLTNTGDMDGSEAVQIYAEYLEQEGEPAKLVWTKKVSLNRREKNRVEFEIPLERLKKYESETDCQVVRKGLYRIILAKDAKTPLFETEVHVR